MVEARDHQRTSITLAAMGSNDVVEQRHVSDVRQQRLML
jgi:hypothetical protein